MESCSWLPFTYLERRYYALEYNCSEQCQGVYRGRQQDGESVEVAT